MDPSALGKWIVITGLGIALFGAVVWLAGKAGLPFGSLPGDVHVGRPGLSFGFPVVTCIVVSIVLSVILTLVLRLFGK